MTPAESAFAMLYAELEGEVERELMKDRPALRHDQTLVAILDGDVLGVRLAADAPELEGSPLRLEARGFDAHLRGGELRDWVGVPLDHQHEWPRLVRAAIERADTVDAAL